MPGIILTALSLLMSFMGLLACGFVTQKLWEWFLVPLLQVEPISFGLAVGIAIIVQWLKYRAPTKVTIDTREQIELAGQNFGLMLVLCLITLVFGWIASYWV